LTEAGVTAAFLTAGEAAGTTFPDTACGVGVIFLASLAGGDVLFPAAGIAEGTTFLSSAGAAFLSVGRMAGMVLAAEGSDADGVFLASAGGAEAAFLTTGRMAGMVLSASVVCDGSAFFTTGGTDAFFSTGVRGASLAFLVPSREAGVTAGLTTVGNTGSGW
jgi:hypothetical protein